jgi:hypothetical protein
MRLGEAGESFWTFGGYPIYPPVAQNPWNGTIGRLGTYYAKYTPGVVATEVWFRLRRRACTKGTRAHA